VLHGRDRYRDVAYHEGELRLEKIRQTKKGFLEYQLVSGEDSYGQSDGLDQRTAGSSHGDKVGAWLGCSVDRDDKCGCCSAAGS
jgi:hypothetical protein